MKRLDWHLITQKSVRLIKKCNYCNNYDYYVTVQIDYPDVTLMTQPQPSVHHHHHHTKRRHNAHNSHNIERLLAATAISNHDNDTEVAPPTVCHTRCKSDSSVVGGFILHVCLWSVLHNSTMHDRCRGHRYISEMLNAFIWCALEPVFRIISIFSQNMVCPPSFQQMWKFVSGEIIQWK